LVDCWGSEGRAELGDRVGMWTPLTLVELAPVGMALMVPTALVGMALDAEGVGVGVGDATTG
jgi:hypothetical protein